MKSTDAQTIDASAEAAVLVLADPRFYLHRESSESIDAIELVDHLVDEDRVRLQIRFAFTGQLNAAARAILDPDRLTWIQSTEHDLATGRVVFTILPDHYRDRIRCRGRYRIAPDGDGTSKRIVATELHVKAPLVAGQVERVLMDGLRNELEAQARAIPDYVP
ncbi:MAG TPA: DUF2505 family protein [Acidimicrobiales bacterium]|nr:DUF2505 family protein [Acidimicrobiales bacterium]